MSANKKNRTIEEIFQDQFRDYQVKPSKGVWPSLQRKVRLREFLRFNPGNFNIYYLGAVIATAGIVSLFTFKSQSDSPLTSTNPVQEYSISLKEQSRVVEQETENTISKGSAAASERVTTYNKIEVEKSEEPLKQTNNASPEQAPREEIKQARKADVFANQPELNNTGIVKPKQLPTSSFLVDNFTGCLPLKVNFENLSANFDSLIWEFGDGGYSKEIEPVWIFDEDGEYKVSLIVFGKEGKTEKSEVVIKVYPLPVAKFEVNTGDPNLPDEQVVFYNYSENAIDWSWDFGDGETSNDFEPVHIYDKHNSYSVKLVVMSPFGCFDSLIITNAFGANSCYLKFPNAFMPNTGGPTGGYYSNRTDIEAEVFHPAWSGVTEYNLKVFSRTGQLVFQTNDISIGWDGYYRGQKSDPGVYIWKVRGMFKNGEPFVQGGDLTLIPRQ